MSETKSKSVEVRVVGGRWEQSRSQDEKAWLYVTLPDGDTTEIPCPPEWVSGKTNIPKRIKLTVEVLE